MCVLHSNRSDLNHIVLDAAAEFGRNPTSKHQCLSEYGDEQADAGRNCQTNSSREIEFSGANEDREIFILPVQLTTNTRIGKITQLIINFTLCTNHKYIHNTQ